MAYPSSNPKLGASGGRPGVVLGFRSWPSGAARREAVGHNEEFDDDEVERTAAAASLYTTPSSRGQTRPLALTRLVPAHEGQAGHVCTVTTSLAAKAWLALGARSRPSVELLFNSFKDRPILRLFSFGLDCCHISPHL